MMKYLSFCFFPLFELVFLMSSCTDKKHPYICDLDDYIDFTYDDFSCARDLSFCDSLISHSVEIDIIANELDVENPEFLIITTGRLWYRGFEVKNVRSVNMDVCLGRECGPESIYVVVLDRKNHIAYNFGEKDKDGFFLSELQKIKIILYPNGTYKIVNDNWFYDLIYD